MKRKILFYLLILNIIFITSCHQNQNTVIQGQIQNLTPPVIYLYKVLPDEMILIDSTKIKNHKFNFNPEISEIGFYLLALNPENNVMFIIEPHQKLKINIRDTSLVASTSIEGSEENIRMRYLDSLLMNFSTQADHLMTIYQNHKNNDSIRASVESSYLKMCTEHRHQLDEFIRLNPDSFAQIMAFYQKFNRRFFYSETKDITILQQIYNHLYKKYPENTHVQFIGQRCLDKSK